MGNVVTKLEKRILDLLRDHVNAHAAFDVQQCLADTMPYRLFVLLVATSRALGWTLEFVVDTLYSLVGSIINKDITVQMGKYRNKHRYWSNGVAESGKGKSPSVKPLVKLLQDVLEKTQIICSG